MMPPVMAQIVATLILLRREDFVLDFLDFLDFLFLHLVFLEHLVLLLMVLGIMLVLSFFILILSRFPWVTGNHISQSVTSGCNLVELPCRKLVPVRSTAVAKSLVAEVDVCLQNKLPIIKS